MFEKIKSFFNKVVNGLQEDKDKELIDFWKKQYNVDKQAKAEWNERFDAWNAMYDGNREFNNVSEQNLTLVQQRELRTIVNFPRMVIESLIDLNVPEPDLKAVSLDDEDAIEELKNYVNYVCRSANPSLEEINLYNERRVLKLGGAFFKVHWDNSIKRAGYVGDITLSMPHPKDIIPNKGATCMDDLEHYHHVTNRTAKYIMRKWPHITEEMLENKAQYEMEYDAIEGSQRINVNNVSDNDKDSGLAKYTVIETTYRDADGDICKLWWSGDLLINHLPKFFYRRDENGELLTTDGEMPYFIPKCWDLIYQPFIPRDKCFWGVSIMEDIWDLQEAIKKAIHIQEESFLRGRKKIIVNSDDLKGKLQDPTSEFVVVEDPVAVKEVSLDSGIDGINWIEKLKEWMQLLTGATNTALGVAESSVTSDKQAQTYIEQANFKVQLKSAYKAAAYKKLYRTIAEFALAFCDQDRAYRLSGERSQELYGTFNRMNMLKDQSGHWVYPDFDVEVGADNGFMKSKQQIFNGIINLAATGRFEPNKANLYVLKTLRKIGVPMLDEIIEDMEQEIQTQEQMQKQAILDGLTPEERAAFEQLPLEEQEQMLKQAQTP